MFKKALFSAYTRKLWLVQDAFIGKIASNFNRNDADRKLKAKALVTPMAIEEMKFWDGTATNHQIQDFQRRVGSLTYAAIVSRPEIAKATQKLAEVQQNPSQDHLEAANR
ncbi:hypothetical protein OnM2_078050, partial [Erysiphe neolycopersici]